MIIFCEFLKKYRRLVVKNKDAQNLIRQLSSCLIEKYSSFTQFLLKYEKKKQRKLFKPIDITYKPTKRIEMEPLCYFSSNLSKVYSYFYSAGEKERNAMST